VVVDSDLFDTKVSEFKKTIGDAMVVAATPGIDVLLDEILPKDSAPVKTSPMAVPVDIQKIRDDARKNLQEFLSQKYENEQTNKGAKILASEVESLSDSSLIQNEMLEFLLTISESYGEIAASGAFSQIPSENLSEKESAKVSDAFGSSAENIAPASNKSGGVAGEEDVGKASEADSIEEGEFERVMQENRPAYLDFGVSESTFRTFYEISSGFFHNKEFDKATSCLHFLTFLDAFCHEVWLLRGMCLQKEEEAWEAFYCYSMAILTNPSNPLGYLYRAKSNLSMSNIDAAAVDLEYGESILTDEDKVNYKNVVKYLRKGVSNG
jgi:hypothetical protein